ncbi:hypothetical protein SDJN02_26841 [Cucurbita argyrosperma subsp. argyrosperma]|nr:hypothetical protein SDJN02_26841 [Cucurbita argyrosperma subsp. argyrosperma]
MGLKFPGVVEYWVIQSDVQGKGTEHPLIGVVCGHLFGLKLEHYTINRQSR